MMHSNAGMRLPLGNFEVAKFIHHHVQKRQTTNIEDTIDCLSTAAEYQCSSGYTQKAIDIALSCRNETYARLASISCAAKREDGERCVVAALRLSSDLVNGFQCSSAVSSGSCPSGCRSFLESARSKLGCCFNTYINTTDNPLYTIPPYTDVVDYRLWNLCSVELPPAGCGNALALNPPADARTCTAGEFISRLVNYHCMQSVGQPLVDALLQNSKCNTYARTAAGSCALNPDGQYCAEIATMDAFTGAATDNYFTSLTTNCGSGSSSFCSSSCRNAVTNIKNAYGCCVNIYNDSVPNAGDQSLFPSLSYSVWNSCGVETPGFCTATLSASAATPSASTATPSASAVAMQTFNIWLLIAAIALWYSIVHS